jgi:tetratricopeptide (TPR) repeat protein
MPILLLVLLLLCTRNAIGQPVEIFDAKDIYLIDYTEGVPVLSLQLRNTRAEKITVFVSVQIPEYLRIPTNQKVTLDAGASQKLSISVPLLQTVFALTEPKQVEGIISIKGGIVGSEDQPVHSEALWSSLLERFELTKSFPLTLYDVGYLNGETEMARLKKATRLITPKDPVIIQQLEMFEMTQEQQNRKPTRCYHYLQDVLKPGKGAFNPHRAMLPRQLVLEKFGSQRDCLLLYATLLEGCGFRTALGYSGEPHASDWLLLYSPVTSPETLEWNGRAWNAVSLRALSRTFEQACADGLQVWNRSFGNREVIDVDEQWEIKPPLQPPSLEALKVAAQLQEGIELAGKGEAEAALEKFRDILKMYSDNAAAYNNLGNLLLKDNQLEEAVKNYQKALSLDQMDMRIHLNLGIAYYLLDDKQETDRVKNAFDQAYAGTSSYRNMCISLGLEPVAQSVDGYQTFRELLQNAEDRHYKKNSSEILASRGLQKRPVYWKVGF